MREILGGYLQIILNRQEEKMTFFKKLIKDFGYNQPILVSEVEYDNYDSQSIYRELSRLCAKKLVVRFQRNWIKKLSKNVR